jgi:DNA-binding CsgD family transcriptional regulator
MAYAMQFANESLASSLPDEILLGRGEIGATDTVGSTPSPAHPMLALSAQKAPEIRYFDESDLDASVRDDELGDETHIAADLGAARSADERMRLVRGMLRIVGFDTLAHLTVKTDSYGRIERLYFLRTYRSVHLAEHYFTDGYHEHDPRFAAAMSSSTPLVWDMRRLTDMWRRQGSPHAMRALFERLREHGSGSGIVFGVPIPHTRLRSIISIVASSEHADWITDSVLIQALTLGLSIHQRSSAYVRAIARSEAAADLSELQTRILGFLAAGLSDKEIALRLDTTAHNVDYHLRRLRQKCGVANRTQLAFLAGQIAAM